MKKTLVILMLSFIMLTGSVVGSEIKAEASTSTVVGSTSVAKALLFLLALAGVSVGSSEMLDYETYDFTNFENSLRTVNPNLYTTLELWKSGITAGKTSMVFTRSLWNEFREYVRSYFGVDDSVSTSIGTGEINLKTHTASWHSFNCIIGGQQGNYRISGLPTSGYYLFYGVRFRTDSSFPDSKAPVFYRIIVVPTSLTSDTSIFDNLVATDSFSFVSYITTPTIRTSTFAYSGKSVAYADITLGTLTSHYNGGQSIDLTMPRGSYLVGSYGPVTNNYYTPQFTDMRNNIINLLTAGGVSSSVDLKPLEGADDVATAVDNTLVGAGSVAQEEDGDVVITGDIPVNLAGVNIDDWLASLADSITDYQTAVKALGIEVVNTTTMTQEDIQDIAQSLSTTVAGTDYITGNYTVDLTGLFPFCIPFDLYKIIECFKADPVAPSATISLPVAFDGSTFTWEEYTVSLQDFDTVATVVRVFEYVLFVIGLMLITRKLIEG